MKKRNINAYLSCEKFVDNIFDLLKERYRTVAYKDVIYVELDEEESIVVFKYGVIVCWNIRYEDIKFFRDFLQTHELNPLKTNISEGFDYVVSNEYKIQEDTIYMDSQNIYTKIAISHAIAQALKLEVFETLIQNSINDNAKIPNQLVQNGKIDLNKKDISKKLGELFLIKSSLNLHYELLDTPEFFWEYSEYENYYDKMIKYLDLKARVEVLNKKVEVIQELFDMLKSEQNHKYSSFLEWIIILLISFEIVMNILEHIIN